MISVSSIQNGLVIDHIRAGQGLKLFYHLGCDRKNLQTALILNVSSNKLGTKDMIKIENVSNFDLDKLGLIAPEATVCVIETGKMVKKFKLTAPERVENVLKCKNPRCATTIEVYVSQIFEKVPFAVSEYRCIYCDEIQKVDQI